MAVIDSFRGEYRFLSNFYGCLLAYNGHKYMSAEHAYQAMKAVNESDRCMIQRASSPGAAKRLGQTVKLKEDWEKIKMGHMLGILIAKFEIPSLRDALLATDDAELIEGNTWGDTFWGVCNGVGENNLGKLLMRVRDWYRSNHVDRDQRV